MKMLKTGLLVALVGGAMLTATAASAQDWRYDGYVAQQAHRDAQYRAYQAGRDQRAADEAAYYGDYRAANAYAHDASIRRSEARRAARFAHEAKKAEYWDSWRHRGWGW